MPEALPPATKPSATLPRQMCSRGHSRSGTNELRKHHKRRLQAQARLVQSTVRRYLQEGVSARDIVVLVLPISDGRRAFVDALRAMPLPDGVQWTEDVHGDPRKVLVDTVARFKGLEAAVLVLWLGLDIDDAIHRELLYVGTSRARSRLVLVGTRDACEAVAHERER
jgi:hypothetical protein